MLSPGHLQNLVPGPSYSGNSTKLPDSIFKVLHRGQREMQQKMDAMSKDIEKMVQDSNARGTEGDKEVDSVNRVSKEPRLPQHKAKRKNNIQVYLLHGPPSAAHLHCSTM